MKDNHAGTLAPLSLSLYLFLWMAVMTVDNLASIDVETIKT